MFNRTLLLILLGLFLTTCTPSESADASSANRCGTWLPNSHAEYFALEVCGGDTALYLLNPSAPDDTLSRFSTQNPFRSLVTISTTHIPLLAEVGAIESLVGAGYLEYVRDPQVRKMISDGKITDVIAADKLNYEQVIDLQPEALLVYPYGGENYDRYKSAGIVVLPISEYAESHPLGRLEWIKVAGLITGNYSRAVRRFEAVREAYLRLAQVAAEVEDKPLVFTGSFYKGRWTAPGGDSFVARLIEDAGGKYAFADYAGSENISLDFEVVLTQIADAEFFGKVLYREGQITRQDFIEENTRFALMNDFEDEQLFYCNTFAADYFGRGLLEPHVMLHDLHSIFQYSADSAEYHYFMPIKE